MTYMIYLLTDFWECLYVKSLACPSTYIFEVDLREAQTSFVSRGYPWIKIGCSKQRFVLGEAACFPVG